MKRFLTEKEVAEVIQPPVADQVGWVKRRFADGRIPGAVHVARGVWRIPAPAFDEFLAQKVVQQPEVVEVATPELEEMSVADGLSSRARRRLRSA